MPDVPDPLDEVVRRMRDGDDEAFRLVYRAVQPPLLRYLEVLVGRDDAEDVASETWVQASRDLARFEGGADGFRAWVTTIGRHRALDLLRQRSRRVRPDQDLTGVDPVGSTDAEASALEALSTEDAVRLIAGLPIDQAEAVMLRAVMGLDARTAGRVLGKRAGAVRSAAQRGLRTLERRLEAAPGEVRRHTRAEPAGGVRDIFGPFGAEGVR